MLEGIGNLKQIFQRVLEIFWNSTCLSEHFQYSVILYQRIFVTSLEQFAGGIGIPLEKFAGGLPHYKGKGQPF
jgi:hypothetical protein